MEPSVEYRGRNLKEKENCVHRINLRIKLRFQKGSECRKETFQFPPQFDLSLRN